MCMYINTYVYAWEKFSNILLYMQKKIFGKFPDDTKIYEYVCKISIYENIVFEGSVDHFIIFRQSIRLIFIKLR